MFQEKIVSSDLLAMSEKVLLGVLAKGIYNIMCYEGRWEKETGAWDGAFYGNYLYPHWLVSPMKPWLSFISVEQIRYFYCPQM